MKVGIIMGSVRAKRVCPEIAAYVKRTIENSEELIDQKLKIQVVDLQQIALPLYEDDDELIDHVREIVYVFVTVFYIYMYMVNFT